MLVDRTLVQDNSNAPSYRVAVYQQGLQEADGETRKELKNRHNEDQYCKFAKNGILVAGVFDGNGGTPYFRDMKGESGACLGAKAVKEFIEGIEPQDGYENYRWYALSGANSYLRTVMKKNDVDISDPKSLWNVSAALLACHRAAGYFEYAIIGNCLIMVIKTDGSWEVFTGNSGNCEGALNGCEESLSLAITGIFPLEKISKIILMTDGFILPRENPQLPPDYQKMADIISDAEKGAYYFCKEIRFRENLDPDGIKYPRVKKHDDGTLIEINF